ncbi:MAG: hypothetical protein HQ488_04220 [Parcubacteria group bacterium]|nr:hypothetical protein [Parcubacteria group bacterium]
MFVTVITDCRDDNARTRQETRYAHLFPGTHISFIGAQTDLEAAGNLLDILDVSDDSPGVIAVNVAPRCGRAKKWENGSPFGFCRVGKKLVVGTVDGVSFGFLKKLGLAKTIHVTDIPTILKFGGYEDSAVLQAATTQFRSLNYLPRLARIAFDHEDAPSEPMSIEEVPDVPSSIWWIDSFGNAKTTFTEEDINFVAGEKRTVQVNVDKQFEVVCTRQLKDVADNQTALIVGSSGYHDHRFIEIVVQGARTGSARKKHDLNIGDHIEIS